MTTTDTNTQVKGHLDDIDDALDAFASDETVSLADYVEGLEDLHYRLTAALDAARFDLSRGKG